ncbi:MAG: YezD family protein [Clostridia bacterium]|nr:YezD family protein [Clostridia bacterium]
MPGIDDTMKVSYLEIIENLIKEMKYGTITVIVQDGKVIQIDKTDKIRLKN